MQLKKIRKKYNYSQAEFAKVLNVKTRTYTSWERGENQLPIREAIKIADFAKISLDELYGRETKLVNLDFVNDNTLQMLLTNYNKLNHSGQRQLLNISRSLIYNPDYLN